MSKIDKFIDTYISMLNDNIIIEDDQQSNILAKVYRELVKIKVKAPKIRMSSNKKKANANANAESNPESNPESNANVNAEAKKPTKSDDKADSQEFIIENEEVLNAIEIARNKFKENIENIATNCKNMKTFLSENFLKNFSDKIKELNDEVVEIIEEEKKRIEQTTNNSNNNNNENNNDKEEEPKTSEKPKTDNVDVTINNETDKSETKN
jgi:hypothetical protein